MHVLFVHKNFPAQFGHIAHALVHQHGWQCTFLSQLPDAEIKGIQRLQYKVRSGATQATHYCSRTFENAIWHSHAVYEIAKAHPELRPDLIVGHSGFGSTLFLKELYDCQIVNYFEYYYRSRDSDLDFRPDQPVRELDRLRSQTRNAMILLDLQACTVGYCPTAWQRSLFPVEYQAKLSAIHDGIDTTFWRKRDVPRVIAGQTIPADMHVVTYVSRGFESMRGFDIFMQVAGQICKARSDVLFVCVGSDRVAYGGDLNHIAEKSFREHVLAQDDYDLDRFLFTGAVKPTELVNIFSLSDLHIYLTVPFVLSWSLLNALACECTVLASATPPVEEMIQHNSNGLLCDFFDVDGFTKQALCVLDRPEDFGQLGKAGKALIDEKYSLETTLPQLLHLLQATV